jgi:hypothetical protein
MGEMRNSYKISAGIPEASRSLKRPRVSSREDDIKTDFKGGSI